MFTSTSKIVQNICKKSLNQFASGKSGNLYTWGSYTSGTGFFLENTDPNVNVPKKVENFDGNVAKVIMGPYHSAVITDKGDLYTMGCGKYGALGQNIGPNSSYEPKKVEFFSEKELKVKDAVLGQHHSIVVTEDGDVWSWGFGGSYDFSPLDWINPRTGALGSGLNSHRYSPGKIEGVSKPASISTGDNFAIAVSQQGDVLNWGCGADGSLADGLCEGVLTPQVNDNFKLLKEKENLTIKQIKSASHFSVALMSDGNLYAWGRNQEGAMGIRANIGHVTDQVATLPTKVVNNYFKDQKIVDYSVGENSLVVLTDKNQVFWSGLDLAYKPVQWEIPTDKKITKIVASKDSFAALAEDGKLYTFNEFVSREKVRWQPGSEYSVAGKELFGNQNVVEIGGSYGIRYAIAQ